MLLLSNYALRSDDERQERGREEWLGENEPGEHEERRCKGRRKCDADACWPRPTDNALGEACDAEGGRTEQQGVDEQKERHVGREVRRDAPKPREQERVERRIVRGGRGARKMEVAVAMPGRERLGEDDVHAVVMENAHGVRLRCPPRDRRRQQRGEHHEANVGSRSRLRFHQRPRCNELGRYSLAHASTPYRDSFRYSVDGSMPSTSAVRDLLPLSLCSTHMMYARSTASSVGLGGVRVEMSGSARGSVMRSGSAPMPISSPAVRMIARSSAFSSSRTLPGQAYSIIAEVAASVSCFAGS